MQDRRVLGINRRICDTVLVMITKLEWTPSGESLYLSEIHLSYLSYLICLHSSHSGLLHRWSVSHACAHLLRRHSPQSPTPPGCRENIRNVGGESGLLFVPAAARHADMSVRFQLHRLLYGTRILNVAGGHNGSRAL